VPASHANAHGDSDGNAYADCNANSYTDAYINSHFDSYAESHADADPNTDCYCTAQPDAKVQPSTKSSPHSSATAVGGLVVARDRWSRPPARSMPATRPSTK
jgi:hypothetical protein